MLPADPTLQLVLDLAGVFVFGLSGGLVAVHQGLDLFGVLVLAVVAGLGGGTVRDLCIGDVPPVALEDWRYVTVAVAAGATTFVAHPGLARAGGAVRLFDAAGLALFCVTGASKALGYGLAPLPAALLGMVTAVGGGVARDVLAGQVPVVLHRELYAVPALLGASVVVVAAEAGWPPGPVAVGAALLAFVLRMLAVLRDWHAPRPPDPPAAPGPGEGPGPPPG